MRLSLTIVGYATVADPPPECEVHEILTRREWHDDELLDALGSLGGAYPGLGVDVALRYRNGRKSVARLQGGRVRQLAAQGAMAKLHQRLSAEVAPQRISKAAAADPLASMTAGAIDERIIAIGATVRRLGPRAIPPLLAVLDDRVHGADPDIRTCIFDVLSWHQTDEVHERFVRALAVEDDVVVDRLGFVLWRQKNLVRALPSLLSTAWHELPRNTRHCERLIAAVRACASIELDDDWLRGHDVVLQTKLGRAPTSPEEVSLAEHIGAVIERGLANALGFRELCADIDRAPIRERDDALRAHEAGLMELCNRSRSPRVRGLVVDLLARLGTGKFRIAALAAGLPRTGTLRDVLAADHFDGAADVAWQTEGGHDIAVDLPALSRVLLCGESGIALCGAGGVMASLADLHHSAIIGVVSAADAESALYICAAITAAGDHQIVWIRARADELDVIGAQRLDSPVRGLVGLGDGAMCTTDSGAAYLARHGELVEILPPGNGRCDVARVIGGDGERAFLAGADLRCVGSDGATVWVSANIAALATGNEPTVALTASGLYCATDTTIVRVDGDTGAVVETQPVAFAASGIGLEDDGVVALDGTRCFGEPVASGLLVRPGVAAVSFVHAPLAHHAIRSFGTTTAELCRLGLIISREGGAEQLLRVPHPVCLGPSGAGVALVRVAGASGPWHAYRVA